MKFWIVKVVVITIRCITSTQFSLVILLKSKFSLKWSNLFKVPSMEKMFVFLLMVRQEQEKLSPWKAQIANYCLMITTKSMNWAVFFLGQQTFCSKKFKECRLNSKGNILWKCHPLKSTVNMWETYLALVMKTLWIYLQLKAKLFLKIKLGKMFLQLRKCLNLFSYLQEREYLELMQSMSTLQEVITFSKSK